MHIVVIVGINIHIAELMVTLMELMLGQARIGVHHAE